jgi:hypothetical protein
VQAIKWLRGKPKSVEELVPGEFRYTSQDDRSITLHGSVHTLLSDSTVTQNIYNIYGPPMADQSGVDDVRTYLEGKEDAAVTVKRDEIQAIRDFVAPAESSPESEFTKEIVHPGVLLNPKRGAFGDDPKDWSFWRGDQIITATVKDKEFLSRYASGIIRLNEADLLNVDLLERQRVMGTKVQKPSYEVIRVIDYRKGGSDDGQMKLT